MNTTVRKAYDEARSESLALLDAIEKHILNHAHKIEHDESNVVNWEHLGSMAHVAAQLSELHAFLKGSK